AALRFGAAGYRTRGAAAGRGPARCAAADGDRKGLAAAHGADLDPRAAGAVALARGAPRRRAIPVPFARQTPDSHTLVPAAEGPRGTRRDRSVEVQLARAAARLRNAPARGRSRSSRAADAAGPRRYRHDADLHARRFRPP